MVNADLRVRRTAMIRRIVDRQEGIGKTKIQKITYFLQESLGVPLAYPFRMHYYGPYSNELDGALSLTESLGYIDITPDPNGFGYHVTSVEEHSGVSWHDYDMSKDSEIRNRIEDIDSTIDSLGALDIPKIELYATIHFIGGPKGDSSKKQTLDTVKRLKPKFSEYEISDAYQALRKANLI